MARPPVSVRMYRKLLGDCFLVTLGDPAAKRERDAKEVAIEPRLEHKPIHAGDELEMSFRLTNPGTHEPHSHLKDVQALAFLAPGIWQKRVLAEAGEDGVYRVKLTVPETGIYYVFLESDSLKLKLNASRPLIFEAVKR